jgi:TRAP-type C4-dicarboxylate transport system substrate-binding protein
MKRNAFLGSLIILILSIMLVSSSNSEATPETATQPITLIAVSLMAKNNPVVACVQKFVDLVDEKSDGKIIIDWRGGPEVIPGGQQPRAVWSGSVDIALTDTSYFATESPSTRPLVDMVPLTGAETRSAGIFDWANQQLQKVNLRFLGMGAYGADAYLWSRNKFEKPQDIAGVIMRGSPADDVPLKALGAKTITVDFMNIYSALERGMVNGMIMPVSGVVPFGSHEIVKFCYEPVIRSGPCQMVMNLDKWNSLTDTQKDIINQAMIEMENWEVDRAKSESDKLFQKFFDAGGELITWTGEDAKYYLDTAKGALWKTYLSADPAVAKLKELLGE